jgi:hypothetical protein
MIEPLSKQLAELSAHAKNAEDAVAAAQNEAHEKLMARREQTRAAVESAIGKVDQDIKSVGKSAANKWDALQSKVATDMDTLKTKIAKRKHDLDARLAEDSAESLEYEASFAIDYAIASVEQARLAVFDAIVGRAEAEQAKRA